MSSPLITSSNFLTKGSLKWWNSIASFTKQVNLSYGLANITNPSHTPDPYRINLSMIIQSDVVPKTLPFVSSFSFSQEVHLLPLYLPLVSFHPSQWLPSLPHLVQIVTSLSSLFPAFEHIGLKTRPWLGFNLFQMNVIYRQTDKARTHLVYLRGWGGGLVECWSAHRARSLCCVKWSGHLQMRFDLTAADSSLNLWLHCSVTLKYF